MSKLKPGLFIGTDGTFKRVSIDPKRGLDDYYALIGTDIVERLTLQALGRSVEVWADEEGLLRAEPVLNHMARRLIGYPIVGNVILHGRSLDHICEEITRHGITINEEGTTHVRS